MKIKLTWKIWLFIIVLIFALISIFGLPPSFFQKGAVIISVESNSTAFNEGLRQGQIIVSIDGETVNNLADFSSILQQKFPASENVKTIITTTSGEYTFFSKNPPEIIVSDIEKTNIKTGLDLSGGSRALVKAQEKSLSISEVNDLIAVIDNRLNVYGISDVKIAPVSDLAGNNYMLVEIARATPKDLETLISQQGKFEAKIGNETAFIGGERDIASVCRNDATCAGIESCTPAEGGYFCNFRFVVYLSEDAARRHAGITSNLTVNETNPQYLSKTLDLYLDDKLVDTLLISKGLQGRVTTQIQIQGSGSAAVKADAIKSAEESMHKLQTILITGSLPYKLEIVKLDTISPLLGKEFLDLIFLAGGAALLSIALTVFIRYRRIKPSLIVMFTCVSELIITLGVASFIDWNLDLPSIAGILAAIGTGVDDQIVILDESRQGTSLSISQRLKRAFAIIVGAYSTVVVSLLPLLWAGAGLLKGFAITTLIGITIGVFITRPAFMDMIKRMEE